jgi:hypothetical protein
VAAREPPDDPVELGALRRGEAAGAVVALVRVAREVVELALAVGVAHVDGLDRAAEVRQLGAREADRLVGRRLAVAARVGVVRVARAQGVAAVLDQRGGPPRRRAVRMQRRDGASR